MSFITFFQLVSFLWINFFYYTSILVFSTLSYYALKVLKEIISKKSLRKGSLPWNFFIPFIIVIYFIPFVIYYANVFYIILQILVLLIFIIFIIEKGHILIWLWKYELKKVKIEPEIALDISIFDFLIIFNFIISDIFMFFLISPIFSLVSILLLYSPFKYFFGKKIKQNIKSYKKILGLLSFSYLITRGIFFAYALIIIWNLFPQP